MQLLSEGLYDDEICDLSCLQRGFRFDKGGSICALGFRVQGLGFAALVTLGFRVQVEGFGVSGLGL